MYELMKTIILPPTSLLLVALVGYFFWRRSTSARRLVAASLVMLYLFSTPLVGDILLSSLEIFPPLSADSPMQDGTQAIVILSAETLITPEYPTASPGPLTLERLRYGAFLNRKTGLPILVTGGTPPERSISMGAVMQQSLVDDFNSSATWVEDQSQDTHQNAERSAQILKNQGISQVFLVTHAWHMPRAKLAFERAGIVVIPAPTIFVRKAPETSIKIWDLLPSAKGFQNSYFMFHELFGFSYYWVAYSS